ncbi:hypothetical protein [Candidatus Phytoplasma crotalariae]|uniref:hypothetical protein n=1 Tax=Candidatus Phytoplasma crotalariae TaxID=2982627 RepID=UPI0027152E2C|nr:hypothetical protein ['Crotalaria aegyptiaca' phytoplasma]
MEYLITSIILIFSFSELFICLLEENNFNFLKLLSNLKNIIKKRFNDKNKIKIAINNLMILFRRYFVNIIRKPFSVNLSKFNLFQLRYFRIIKKNKI